MSTVIAFPSARDMAARAASDHRRAELSGPKIVILPVVRIERHTDVPAEAPRPAGADAPVRLDLVRSTRAPRGAGPAGRRH
ncbi:hypothetical protein V5F38_02915 [Xanthobacter sp. V0B-10]|uniref:hypothetical protein n=1 Tax=Xanthobacter albus TaxID=3119929 RepID=UPI0037277E4F